MPDRHANCVTTLGKLLTPTCLDADSLRYYMELLNGVPLPYAHINTQNRTIKTIVLAELQQQFQQISHSNKDLQVLSVGCPKICPTNAI